MSSGRRLSTSSSSSDDSISGISGLDSASALILVQDSDDATNSPFDFSANDEDELEETSQSAFEIRRGSIPHLPPSAVFLYLLSPYLKLGALLLPNAALPPKYSIPIIIFFAILSAFCRQIWYMLARYLRATDLEIVILDVFARGRNKENRRDILRGIVRLGTGVLRLLVASIYLRESVRICDVFPNNLVLSSRVTMTIIFAILLIPLSAAQSLAAKRIIITTWISIATYVLWLGLVVYACAQGTLDINSSWPRLGTLWTGTTTAALAFTSSSTIPLSTSLRTTTVHPVITTTKTSKPSSFKILNVISTTVAVALTLPLSFSFAPQNINTSLPVTPAFSPQHCIAWLNASTLLLIIPSILITTPAIPIPTIIRRYTTFPISKIMLPVAVFLTSLAPVQIWRVLSDVLLVFALSGTYFLPAFVHLTTHYIKRPLSIIVSPNTPVPATDDEVPSHDELLQRKERALQRRQLRKRLIWDIGVGVLLVPVGGGGSMWAVGRVARQW